MRLTVVGSAASYAGAGRACSSYLVTTDATRVLLDCGNGSLANLARVVDPLTLDAVFVTHRHPDHFLDLFALQAAIRYAPSGPEQVGPIPLYGPEGLYESMACLLDGRGRDDLHAAFSCERLVAGRPVTVGDLTMTPMTVDHIPDTFALRVANGAVTLCYTSDSRLGPQVLDAARGADVVLSEATLPAEYAGAAPHMTAEEAGELGSAVGARKLVLTHIWPTANREDLLVSARRTFSGDVMLASEMLTIDLT